MDRRVRRRAGETRSWCGRAAHHACLTRTRTCAGGRLPRSLGSTGDRPGGDHALPRRPCRRTRRGLGRQTGGPGVGQPCSEPAEQYAQAADDLRRLHATIPVPGDVYAFGAARLHVVWPQRIIAAGSVPNNASVSFVLEAPQGRAAFSGISNLRRRPRSCAVRTSRPTSSSGPRQRPVRANCLPPCVRNWLSSGGAGQLVRASFCASCRSVAADRCPGVRNRPERGHRGHRRPDGRGPGRGAGSAGKMKTAEVSPRPARSGPARAHGPSGRRRAVRLRATRP